MVSYCKSLTHFAPERALCEVERRRLGAKRTDIEAAGGVLSFAVARADEEYREAFVRPEWQAPQTTRGTFGYTLRQMGIIVPYYFESQEIVNSLHKIPDTSWNTFSARRLADVFLNPDSGWGVRPVDRGLRELLPDQAIQARAALCSEWSYLILGGAVLLGAEVIPVFSQQANGQNHIESFIKIGNNRYWYLPWTLDGKVKRAREGVLVSHPPETGRLSRADMVMVYAINSTLSSNEPDATQRKKLLQLSRWKNSPVIQEWLDTAIAQLK